MLVVNIKSGREATATLTKRGWRVGGKMIDAADFEKNWRSVAPIEQSTTVELLASNRPRSEVCVDPKRDKAWLASVRLLPCVKCGKPPPCEAAHSNQMMWGKGKGTKANDRASFPLCGNPCHVEHDTKRPSDWRELENRWIVDTMLKVLSKNV